jgi:hypothetical protein
MEQEINRPKLSPKFFFLSLGVLVSLITTVTSFLNLAFATLDKKFPDVLNAVYSYGYNTYDFTAMRTSLATLIIFFPVFVILSYLWNKMKKIGIGHIDEIIKKWMLYLVVFLSSIVIVVDLVTLVQYFVSGEITTRFIYKVIITLLVALFVGFYYVLELKGREKFLGMPVHFTSAIKASVFVALIIWFAFSVMGSPKEQRLLRLDDKRMQDLQSIQWQVISFWQQKEKLPEDLKELANPIAGWSVPVDPEFSKGLVYEYKKLADLKFELCATFSMDMPQGWQEYNSYGGGVMPMMDIGAKDIATSSYPYPGGGTNESWDHDAGRTCFERTIDPDIYPPYENPRPL